jgi:hypothetical protein
MDNKLDHCESSHDDYVEAKLQANYIKLVDFWTKFEKLVFFSAKRIKDVEHENESLLIKLSDSHALVDSLRF